MIWKGVVDVVCVYVMVNGGMYLKECDVIVSKVVGVGGILFVVVWNNKVLGVIYLKDIVKNGVKECFFDLWKMGIKIIMIIGDNLMIVVVIVVEVGVDDFLVEVILEVKLELICEY